MTYFILTWCLLSGAGLFHIFFNKDDMDDVSVSDIIFVILSPLAYLIFLADKVSLKVSNMLNKTVYRKRKPMEKIPSVIMTATEFKEVYTPGTNSYVPQDFKNEI